MKASNQVQPFPGAVTLPMTHTGEVWLSTPPTRSSSRSWEGGHGGNMAGGRELLFLLHPGPAYLASRHQRRRHWAGGNCQWVRDGGGLRALLWPLSSHASSHPNEGIILTAQPENYFSDTFLLSTFFAFLFLVFSCRY